MSLNGFNARAINANVHFVKKFAESKDLYFGIKMHDKALNLLRELSEKEDDLDDKLMPTIGYLQKLGPEHLEQIFKSARSYVNEPAHRR
ncbi:hypothetical protein F5887DRAFT_1188588 [Amanita rubescens]|nr:hypothetical protein F5887DRAFT_1188588 [Amanita rubescens]